VSSDDLNEVTADVVLLTAGFHTHHRQWRRKRNGDGFWKGDHCESRTDAHTVSCATRLPL